MKIFITIALGWFVATALFLPGVVTAADEKINNAIQQLAKDALDAGSKTKDVLQADDSSSENELVINDEEIDNNIIDRTIKFIGRLIGTLGVFALVIGGYFMIISNGEEQRITKGKSILFYTIGGLLVAFLAYIIVQYVFSIIFSI